MIVELINLWPSVRFHSTGISLLLSTSAWVLLSPPLNVERLDQRLNVPVHGRCGERRSPIFNPRSDRGLNPEFLIT